MDIDAQSRSYQSILSQDSAIGLIMAQGEDPSTKFIIFIVSEGSYYVLLLCALLVCMSPAPLLILCVCVQVIWGALCPPPPGGLDSTSLAMEASRGLRFGGDSTSSSLLLLDQ